MTVKIDYSIYKKKLETRKKKILSEINRVKKFPDYGSSIEDNAEEIEEFSEGVGLTKKLTSHLKEINEALRKIGNGTYGICAKCSKPINPDRLKSYSAALYCLDDEKKLRSRR